MNEIIQFLDGLLASSAPDKPMWNIEHVRANVEPKWNYIDGCMIKAVMDMYHATGNTNYYTFAKDFIDYYLLPDGSIRGYSVDEHNCDNINEAKVLFDLYTITGEAKYKTAIELINSQLLTQPRLSIGNFWHKKIYPNQIWLDGLYMVGPFAMAYDMTFGGKQNYQDTLSQFKNVYDILRDPETGLYYHGYDETKSMFWANPETGLSKNHWTRSIGWLTMALVDTMEQMAQELHSEREVLQGYFQSLMTALLPYQDPATGLYYQVTHLGDKPGNYLETSGSCAIAYSFMKGARLGYLPPADYDKGKRIFDAVVSHKLVTKDGVFVLKDICLVAGLGGMPGKGTYKERDGTFEYYISEPIVDNDAKGVAPFLFSYAEVLRHESGGN